MHITIVTCLWPVMNCITYNVLILYWRTWCTSWTNRRQMPIAIAPHQIFHKTFSLWHVRFCWLQTSPHHIVYGTVNCSSYPSTTTNTITLYMLYFTDVNTTLLNGEHEKLFDEDAFGFFFFFFFCKRKKMTSQKIVSKILFITTKSFFILNSWSI